MKILEAHIKNFRVIKDLHIDFRGPDGKARPVTVILGDNGSGKTTVLQAIAFVFSWATRKIRNPNEFQWNGFMLERIESQGPTEIEILIEMEQEEIIATQKLCEILENRNISNYDPEKIFLRGPGTEPKLRVKYQKEVVQYRRPDHSKSDQNVIGQLSGRSLAIKFGGNTAEIKELSSQIGDIFWFDQYRDVRIGGNGNSQNSDLSWSEGIGKLRESLMGYWYYHTSDKSSEEDDMILRLEKNIDKVFPKMKFKQVKPMPDKGAVPSSRDFYFLLEKGDRIFDISEMSSGEQAVFAIFWEFAYKQIARSIVLIDELELHLHPPEQQAVYNALPKIGPDCQFIVTTHSRYLEGLTPEEEQIRLKGGRLCL